MKGMIRENEGRGKGREVRSGGKRIERVIRGGREGKQDRERRGVKT